MKPRTWTVLGFSLAVGYAGTGTVVGALTVTLLVIFFGLLLDWLQSS